jgi:very-short-patch-repair endonuclease
MWIFIDMSKKLSINTFSEKGKSVHNDKYDYSLVEYKNNKTKVKIICPEHGEFEQEASSHMRGTGCIKCSGQGKTNEEYINIVEKIHNFKYDYSLTNYTGVFKKIKIICPKHGLFEQMSDKHLRGSGCKICRESKGEKLIKEFLIAQAIKFSRQFIFPDCRDIRPLPFDFYIEDYNVCIEYDGRQHFIAIEKWGGELGLLDQQKKDKIKDEYCKIKNIKLIRIPYNKNPIQELIEIFKK